MMGAISVVAKTMHVSGDLSGSYGLARGRLIMLCLFFLFLYGLVMMRLLDLTLGSDGHSHLPLAVTSLEGRGDIYDRNGALLATNLKVASLAANSGLVLEPEQLARDLVEIFPDLSYEVLKKRLASDRHFVWVKRGLTPKQQRAVLEIGDPALRFDYEQRRVYTKGALGGHVLGYASIDGKGLAGLERSYQDQLAGGEDVTLTLDIRLQHALRREISRVIADFSATAGAGIIMDARDGAVLAAVSMPDFNPHHVGKAAADEKFNRLTLGVYELGSLFKIFSTAALLDHTDMKMSRRFDARKPIEQAGFKIRDFHAEKRILTVPEVFMYSSNIGSALMGEAIGTENLKKFYADLGLLSPLDTDIKEIGTPLVPQPWRDINTLTASFGHGIATSPLQLTSAVASVINGGTLVRPHFVKRDEESADRHALEVVSEETSEKMRQLMRLVVSDGTGAKAEVPGYQLGGKTGTAEKASARGYDPDRLLSSFVGAFPIDNPRYVILIMVDEPKGTLKSLGYATGGWVAAPAAANVVKSMTTILGIPPDRNWSRENDISASLRKYVSKPQEGDFVAFE